MDSLILIPDISGFTEFVNQTEVTHSGHIIGELLELIIDSDQLGLTVSEIEGDAIVFYDKDHVPAVGKLLEQAERTFIAFHTQLREFETRRICRCGACSTAHRLTLKFVAHRGPLEFLKIKDFLKPFGSGMILVHRLLKNEVAEREYVLLSEDLTGESLSGSGLPDWSQLEEGSTSYDDFGEVKYRVASLTDLHDRVPDPIPPEQYDRVEKPVVVEGFVDQPMGELYELISSFDLRLNWNTDVSDFIYEKKRVNRVGTQHQCIVQGRHIDFSTITADIGADALVYGELVEKTSFVRSFATYWILTEEGTGTRLRGEMHHHPFRFPRSLLQYPFKFQLGKVMAKSLKKITEVAEAPRHPEV